MRYYSGRSRVCRSSAKSRSFQSRRTRWGRAAVSPRGEVLARTTETHKNGSPIAAALFDHWGGFQGWLTNEEAQRAWDYDCATYAEREYYTGSPQRICLVAVTAVKLDGQGCVIGGYYGGVYISDDPEDFIDPRSEGDGYH